MRKFRGIALLVVAIEFIWLGSIRSIDLHRRSVALERREICVNMSMEEALSVASLFRLPHIKYTKAVRWDYGQYGHGCTCPGSFGVLTADRDAC